MIEGAFVALGPEDFFFECSTNTHVIIPVFIITIRKTTPLIVPPTMAPVDPALLGVLAIVVAAKIKEKYCYSCTL